MAFILNAFTSKRKAEVEEVELGLGEILGPDTPPIESCNYYLSRADSSELVEADVTKVRDRKEFFESLIRSNETSADVHSIEQPNNNNKKRAISGLKPISSADAFEELRNELARAQRERQLALEALQRKEQEILNLKEIVRELSESRASAISVRASLSEQYMDLQRSHDRLSRVADLSRAVSKENVELTRAARGAAQEATRVALEMKREAAAAGKAESRAALENAQLRQKVNCLQALSLHGHAESVCRRELTATRVLETY